MADQATHRLQVMVDGQEIQNYPVSYGEQSQPGRPTTNGIHVVQEIHSELSPCFGPSGSCESRQWVLRLNNNGEFLTADPASAAFHGVARVPYGAINLGEADAKAIHDAALFGDPVEITNADGPQMSEKDYLYDWSYSPEEWKALSALD